MSILSINPLRCRVWNLHSRLDENLTEESCRSEIESFEKHGQLIPALGRRLRGDPDYDIELIYGARRLFVARHLNLPLLVEVREVSDHDGIVAMELENRVRQDISAYERGTSYDRWLREGHFKSQDEISHALQISAAQVSRLLKLARLPPVVVEAFVKPTDICEVWGAELANLLKDPAAQRRILQAAQSLAAISPRPAAEEIYKQLCTAGKESNTSRATERVIEDDAGEELFRVKYQRDCIVFNVSMDLLTQESLEQIEFALASALDQDLSPGQRVAQGEDSEAELAEDEEALPA